MRNFEPSNESISSKKGEIVKRSKKVFICLEIFFRFYIILEVKTCQVQREGGFPCARSATYVARLLRLKMGMSRILENS